MAANRGETSEIVNPEILFIKIPLSSEKYRFLEKSIHFDD